MNYYNMEEKYTPQGSRLSQYYLDMAINKDSNNAYAWMEKSVAYNKRGDYSTGFKLLNNAVAIDPINHLGYRGWLKLRKIKDYGGCIIDLNKLDTLTKFNPKTAAWGENIHLLLGLANKGSGNDSAAITEFKKYINTEDNPKGLNPYVYVYMGNCYFRISDSKNAVYNYDQAIKLYEYCTEAYYYKGLALCSNKDTLNALVSFQKSLELYKKGYRKRDIYNEEPDEIYEKDIQYMIR